MSLMNDYPELKPVIVYQEGTLQFKGFPCPTCASRQSWDCEDVLERWVITRCRACGMPCKLSKRVLNELIIDSDFILPPEDMTL